MPFPAIHRMLELLHAASQVGVDVVVLEVGIGGKYDSTNFFDRPAIASVITSISYDHQVSALHGCSMLREGGVSLLFYHGRPRGSCVSTQVSRALEREMSQKRQS